MITATLTLAGALSACTTPDPGPLRDELAEPMQFELLPFVSVAELQLELDGQPETLALDLGDGTAVVQANALGDLTLVAVQLPFDPIRVDGNRALTELQLTVDPHTRCMTTQWSDDDESCFGNAAAAFELTATHTDGVNHERAPLELMVSASRQDGLPVIDLMTSERVELPLWRSATLTSITVVLHGVAR